MLPHCKAGPRHITVHLGIQVTRKSQRGGNHWRTESITSFSSGNSKRSALFLFFASVSSVVPVPAELVTIPNRSFLFSSFSSSFDFLEIEETFKPNLWALSFSLSRLTIGLVSDDRPFDGTGEIPNLAAWAAFLLSKLTGTLNRSALFCILSVCGISDVIFTTFFSAATSTVFSGGSSSLTGSSKGFGFSSSVSSPSTSSSFASSSACSSRYAWSLLMRSCFIPWSPNHEQGTPALVKQASAYEAPPSQSPSCYPSTPPGPHPSFSE